MSLQTSIKILLCKIREKPVFLLSVENGSVRQVNGESQFRFLKDCEDVVRENKVKKGLIYGVKNAEGKVSVKTSGEIPAAVAQRLRNVWSFYS